MRKIIFLYILCLVACNGITQDENENTHVFKKFPLEVQVNLERYFLPGKDNMIGLFKKDSSLFLCSVDGIKDYFFYEYSLRKQKIIAQYIKGGRAQGQSLGAYTFGLYKKNTLWLHDIPMSKVVTVDLSDSGKEQVHDYPLGNLYNSVQLMDSLHLLAHGLPNNPYKLQIIDLVTGKTLTEFGRVENAPEGIPLYSWKNANEGFIYLKPEEDKAVIASRYTDQIEIFDLTSKSSKIIKGPENFKPEFELMKGKSDIMRTSKTRFAFMNGVTNSKHIYLMYSGESENRAHRNTAKFIYVYDWDGSPVKKIILNKYVSGFTISDDEKTLYAFDLVTGYVLKSKTLLP